MITSLPEECCHLQSLQHLELKGCRNLSSLPRRFGDLTNLRHLNLCQCEKLVSLPSSFGDLTNLQHLDMRGCKQLRTLPVSFKQLTLLQYLDLILCSELSIESESLDILENMTRLQYLNFSYCSNIKDLPRHIGNGVSLKQLYIYGTRIREVPPNIGQLSKLEILRVGNPELVCLPESFTQLINLQSLYVYEAPISELSFGAGCKLKELELSRTKLSKISISEDCCPCLRTLRLQDNDYLMEIETLPTAMETIELDGCEMLKDMRGICGLVNLEMLSICRCPELDGLPSFAELTSLKTFELTNCHKVEKIEGLEELRSLEEFEAYTCLKVPCIISLEKTRELRKVVVVANEKSVVEHCIPAKHQKWPDKVIICTRAVCNVGSSPVNSLTFPNLSVLGSIANAKIGSRWEELELRHERSPSSYSIVNANAILICIIINVVSPVIHLVIRPDNESDIQSEMELGQGKWVWMGVFTQNSFDWHRADSYRIFEKDWTSDDDENNVVESAWLMEGEVESFRDLFHSFAG